MGQKIPLGAGRAQGRGDHLAGDHITTEDRGTGPMADVLKLPPFDLAGRQRQAGVLALQRLDAREFIGRHGAVALRGPCWRRTIATTDVSDLGVELGILGGGVNQ